MQGDHRPLEPSRRQSVQQHALQGNRTNIIYPDLTSVAYKFDSLGRATNMIDALGTTTNYFDNLSRLVAVSNAVGQVAKTVYDIEDRATSVTDANGVTVTQTFDNLHRLLTRTYQDTGLERYGYSPGGLVKYTNQLNQVTSSAEGGAMGSQLNF